MPRFHFQSLLRGGSLALWRVCCDGHDAPRPAPESSPDAHAVIPLSGRFAHRGRHGRTVLDPTRALLAAPGDEATITHPGGEGDVCLSARGAAVDALLAGGRRTVAIAAPAQARLARTAAALVAGRVEPLAAEETITAALAPPEDRPRAAPAAAARAVADAIVFTLAARFDEPLSLAELADVAGVSVFHACRLFRRATGTTIHRHHVELRLRHALALLLDTRRPIAEIAAHTGFANQAHLGNRFRARFGVTPAQARAGARVA